MSAPSAGMICGRPSNCRASQALTITKVTAACKPSHETCFLGVLTSSDDLDVWPLILVAPVLWNVYVSFVFSVHFCFPVKALSPYGRDWHRTDDRDGRTDGRTGKTRNAAALHSPWSPRGNRRGSPRGFFGSNQSDNSCLGSATPPVELHSAYNIQ